MFDKEKLSIDWLGVSEMQPVEKSEQTNFALKSDNKEN